MLKAGGRHSSGVTFEHVAVLSFILWTVLSLSPSYAYAQRFPAPKRVLVLYWYNKDHPWNVKFDQSLQSALESSPTAVEYYAEYLESNRFPGDKQSFLLRDYLQQKYADRKIDVVIASSDASLDFLRKYRGELFPHAPLVFVATKHPSKEELAAGSGLTGIININAHRETLDLALRLHPRTEEIFVVSGTLQHDKRFETLAREELRAYESRVRVTYITDFTPDELIAKAKSLPKRSIVFYIWQQSENEQHTLLESADILALLAESSPVPIYGMLGPSVGNGIVGGYINTAEAIGSRAAEIVLKILGGVRAQNIPVEDAPTVPIFDWRRLRHWGIDEASLPPGSIIRFRELTLWDKYRWHIITVLAFCVLQSVLIGGLAIERRRRKRANETLNYLNKQLETRIREVKALGRQLITAQEEERRRISRELHDEVCQQLAAVGLAVSAVKKSIHETDEKGRAHVASAQDYLHSLTNSLRQLSHELHPAMLERYGLRGALKSHAMEFESLNGIKVYLSAADREISIPPPIALCLYRVVQESLRNVARHSGAKEAWVRLTESEGEIELTITDSGVGFAPEDVMETGLGLVSMQERVRLLGGSFQVESKRGEGTAIRARMAPQPMAQESASAGGGRQNQSSAGRP